MAAPFSVEAVHGGGADGVLTSGAAPAGGILIEGWFKNTGDRYSMPLAIKNGADAVRLNVDWDSGRTTLTYKASAYTSYTDRGAINSVQVSTTSEQSYDWVGCVIQIVPGSTWTVRLWYRLGTAGSLVGPNTTTFDASTYSLWTGDCDNITIGGAWLTPAFNATAVRVYAASSAPDNATLLARLNSLSADATAWADWSLTWTGGAAVLTDQSGNGRTLTADGTLYQGTAGPIDPASGPYEEALNETNTMAESGSAAAIANAGLAETDDVAEQITVTSSGMYSEELQEGVTAAEEGGAQQTAQVAANESHTVDESLTGGIVQTAGVAETVTHTDEVASAVTHGIVIDHNSVAVFDGLTSERIAAAAAITLMLRHASVGQGIDGWLNTLETGDPRLDRANWGFQYRGNPGWAAKLTDFTDQCALQYTTHTVLMMKFCFVDTYPDPPVSSAQYISTMTAAEAAYPSNKFVWCTQPTVGNSYCANVATFNGAVRTYCSEHGKVLYDIADIESHHVDGSAYLYNDTTEALCPEYNTGDDHPNDTCLPRLAKAFWVLMDAVASAGAPLGQVDLGETVQQSEQTGAAATTTAGVGESLSAVEEQGAQAASILAVAETLSKSEEILGGHQAVVALAEAIVSIEELLASKITLDELSEALAISEEQTAGVILAALLVETISKGEDLGAVAAAIADLDEAGSVGEGISAGGSTTYEVTLEDGTVLSESASAAVHILAGLDESGALDEIIGHAAIAVQALAEQHGLSEEQTARVSAVLAAAEEIASSEDVTGGLAYAITVQEECATVEAVATAALADARLAESDAVQDALAAFQAASQALDDEIASVESMAGGKAIALDLEDTLALAEASVAAQRAMAALNEALASSESVQATGGREAGRVPAGRIGVSIVMPRISVYL